MADTSAKKKPPQKTKANPKAQSETQKPEDKKGGLGQVITRNEFYRDGYRILLKVALIQGIVIIALIGVVYFVVSTKKPENRYFATTEDGRLIPMIALSEPNLSKPALVSWAAQAAAETMTFGFNDYRRKLNESSRNFTTSGWQSFTRALEQSALIERIDANRQLITAIPSGAPIIVSSGVVNGRYQWVLTVPMTLTFEAGSSREQSRDIYQLTVVRVPRLESSSGVGIEQWVKIR